MALRSLGPGMQAGTDTLPEFLDVGTILGIKTMFQEGPLCKTLDFLVTLASPGHGRLRGLPRARVPASAA